jgi:hypothetical protein
MRNFSARHSNSCESDLTENSKITYFGLLVSLVVAAAAAASLLKLIQCSYLPTAEMQISFLLMIMVHLSCYSPWTFRVTFAMVSSLLKTRGT